MFGASSGPGTVRCSMAKVPPIVKSMSASAAAAGPLRRPSISSSVRPGVSTSFNESRTVASSGSNGGGVRGMASRSVRAVVGSRGRAVIAVSSGARRAASTLSVNAFDLLIWLGIRTSL